MKQKGHNNKFQTILKRLEKYLENTDNLKTNIVESLYVWSEKSFGTLHIFVQNVQSDKSKLSPRVNLKSWL